MIRNKFPFLVTTGLLFVLMLFAMGCGDDDKKKKIEYECQISSDCLEGKRCISGKCIIFSDIEVPDNGEEIIDAEVDGGYDEVSDPDDPDAGEEIAGTEDDGGLEDKTDGPKVNTPPQIIDLITPTGAQKGDISISMKLLDLEFDYARLEPYFSIDNGKTYKTARPLENMSQPISTSPQGQQFIFKWNSFHDLGNFEGKVKMKFKPFDFADPNIAGPEKESGEFQLENSKISPPTVELDTPQQTVKDTVKITYRIKDDQGDQARILVKFAVGENGIFYPATLTQDSVTENISTAPTFKNNTFKWDSMADIKIDADKVRLSITPKDTHQGKEVESGFFQVKNKPLKTPPKVVEVKVPRGELTGQVPITFKLQDLESDPVNIEVEYSLYLLKDYKKATLVIGKDQVSGLQSSPAGTLYQVVWDSHVDTGDILVQEASLRIIPYDSAKGIAGYSTIFVLDNAKNKPPLITISTPQGVGARRDIIELETIVSDYESDPVKLFFQYSIDNGKTFQNLTLTSDSVNQNLATSKTGIKHQVKWDSSKDITKNATVIVKCWAQDAAAGSAALTSAFAVDNTPINTPPSINISQQMEGIFSNTVDIPFVLQDRDQETLTMTYKYSTDGVLYNDSTPAQGSAASLLAAAATGKIYTFKWDSLTDLGKKREETVRFKITVSDSSDKVSQEAGPFVVDNSEQNSLPIAIILSHEKVNSDGIKVIHYRLYDRESDPLSMEGQYSDGTVDHNQNLVFKPATGGTHPVYGVTATTNLFSTPSGTDNTFSWNIFNDLGGGIYNNLRFRITPKDSQTGAAAESDTFSVDMSQFNQPPSISIQQVQQLADKNVEIKYTLFNPYSTKSDLEIYYIRKNSGHRGVCTAAAGSGVKTDLATSPQGISYTFLWDAKKDLPAAQEEVSIEIMLTKPPLDVKNQSQVFFIDTRDNLPPQVKLDDLPCSSLAGQVEIPVTIFDQESNQVSLSVKYSLDKQNWLDITPANTSDDISNLSATPQGLKHLVVWDTLLDLADSQNSAQEVQLKFSPQDHLASGSTREISLTVDNRPNTKVTAFIDSVTINQQGLAEIKYYLEDQEEQKCCVKLEYLLPGGPTIEFSYALPAKDTVISDLQSSKAGQASIYHTFLWDAGRYLPPGSGQVTLKLTPFDVEEGIVAEKSTILQVSPNQVPIIEVDQVTSPLRGKVEIKFSLSDGDGDNLTALFEYSLDGSEGQFVEFHRMTGLPPSNGGKYLYVMDTEKLFGKTEKKGVVLRFTAEDKRGKGTPVLFTVDIDNRENGTPQLEILEVTGNSRFTTISYKISDPEGDRVDLKTQWTLSSDCQSTTLSWFNMTGAPGGSLLVGLDAPAAGKDYFLVWDSGYDLAKDTVANVCIRLTPMASDNNLSQGAAAVVQHLVNNVAQNTKPEIFALQSPIGTQKGTIPITMKVADGEANTISIKTQYKIINDNNLCSSSLDCQAGCHDASPAPGSESPLQMSTLPKPDGVDYTFDWDSYKDLQAGGPWTIRMLFTPADQDQGDPVASDCFQVENVGLHPPVVENVAPVSVAPVKNGEVEIKFTVKDSLVGGDLVLVNIDYSLDSGNTFNRATPVSSAVNDFLSSGINATAAGIEKIFLWDSVADSLGAQNTVIIRITPKDSLSAGISGQSAPFEVFNPVTTPIDITMFTPVGKTRGLVIFEYQIKGEDNAFCDINAHYSVDGNSFQPATMGSGGDGNSGLKMEQGGKLYKYNWNSGIDLPATFSQKMVFKITPTSSQFNNPDQTGEFTLDNRPNHPPQVELVEKLAGGIVSGQTALGILVKDQENDSVDLKVEYYFNNTFQDASLVDGGTILQGLPSGSLHGKETIIKWDSAADITGRAEGIKIKLTPYDFAHSQGGTPLESGEFKVNNSGSNNLPKIKSITPPTDKEGNIKINFKTLDLDCDPVSITVEQKLATATDHQYSLATPAALSSSMKNISSCLNGNNTAEAEHQFIWDSKQDCPNLRENIKVRITPRDTEIGDLLESAEFEVDNRTLKPPKVLDLQHLSGFDRRQIKFTYNLFDPNGETANLKVEYSVNDQGFKPAALGEGSDPISNLTTDNASGKSYTFIWQSDLDIGFEEQVAFLQFTPYNQHITGDPVQIKVLVKNTNHPPEAVISKIERVEAGEYKIEFNLLDQEGDLSDLRLDFTSDGIEYIDCTPVQGTNPIKGIATTSQGTDHVFLWNSMADLGPYKYEGVIFRIFGYDGEQGEPALKTSLTIDNTSLPSLVEIDTPSGFQKGEVEITFYLTDPEESDKITIAPQYNPQGPWAAGSGMLPFATIVKIDNQPITDQSQVLKWHLTSIKTQPGQVHTLVWDSCKDMPEASGPVGFKITPRDPADGQATLIEIEMSNKGYCSN